MLQNLNQTDVAQFVSAAVTSYTIPFPNNNPEISFAKKHVAKVMTLQKTKTSKKYVSQKRQLQNQDIKVNSQSQQAARNILHNNAKQ